MSNRDFVTHQEVHNIIDNAVEKFAAIVATSFQDTNEKIDEVKVIATEARDIATEARDIATEALDVSKNSERKIDGLTKRIDAEVLRRADENAEIDERIGALEESLT